VFSDWSGSGDPSTLVSWSLNLDVIPEPTNVALAILVGAFLAFQDIKFWRTRAAR
jgi:hypothetical protein